MAEVIIFGGTTEGRELAEWLARRGIFVLVSVATEYGRRVLEAECDRQIPEPAGGLTVRTGRLDLDGIQALIVQQNPRLVLDATHPHAQEVTRLVRQACDALSIEYERVIRAEETQDSGVAVWADTPMQAAQVLLEDQRPVLLTTGSKELEVFTSVPGLIPRLYARVLPDSRVLAACEALGIRGRQLIAMQGPFSTEMNCALLKAVDAGWLVTKESGRSGGFEEKLEAARLCGVRTVVIRRPGRETGLTVSEAKKLLARHFSLKPETEAPLALSLIGMGMGTGSQLTKEAMDALRGSDVVLGAFRMLEDVRGLTAGKRTEALYLGRDILAWLEANPQYRRAAVVYSGDTGFHSGAASLLAEIQRAGREIHVQVYPGISTVSCLCARFGISWERLAMASAHGQDCDVVELLRAHGRVFLLLGGALTLGGLCEQLAGAGLGRAQIYAGARLGYEDERLLRGTAEQLRGAEFDRLAAVIVEMENDWRNDQHER